jgi:preprotein translocase subunit SecG
LPQTQKGVNFPRNKQGFFMLTFLIVAHVIIAIFLGIVVLMQPGKGGGLVMGGGTSQTLFGATGAGNFFTKLTTVLALLLVVTSLGLTKTQNKGTQKSLFDSNAAPISAPNAPVSPVTPAATPTDPAAPAAPVEAN